MEDIYFLDSHTQDTKYGTVYLFQQIMHIKQMQVGVSQKFRRHKMDINQK